MINPADCKPDEYYLVNVADTPAADNPMLAMRQEVAALPGLNWGTLRYGWHRDDDVTVLHRLVPEGSHQVRIGGLDDLDETSRMDVIADELEHITGDVDTGISPRRLREMAAEQRADAEAQRAEDALVEKTAKAMRSAWLDAPGDAWDRCEEDDRVDWRNAARAALAVFREEAVQ